MHLHWLTHNRNIYILHIIQIILGIIYAYIFLEYTLWVSAIFWHAPKRFPLIWWVKLALRHAGSLVWRGTAVSTRNCYPSVLLPTWPFLPRRIFLIVTPHSHHPVSWPPKSKRYHWATRFRYWTGPRGVSSCFGSTHGPLSVGANLCSSQDE